MAFLIILGGTLLIMLLSLGIANPPRAGALQWSTKNTADWLHSQKMSNLRFYQAPVKLPPQPFTLELIADNEGDFNSGWGIQIESWLAIINREGYFSISLDEKPHWREFIHIQRHDTNKLYLDVRENGTATLRINDEIAWTGSLTLAENPIWGVVHYRHPNLNWQSIEIYAQQLPLRA